MIDQDTVERRVVTALQAKADGLVLRDRPFVDRPPVALEPFHSRRRRRVTTWSVAAVAVAACVVLGLVLSSHRGRVRTDLETTPAPATAPTPVPLGYAPTEVPAGLHPVAVSAARQTSATGTTDQLFGSADGQPELYVDLQPGSGGGDSGTPVQVRGQSGRSAPAKEFAAATTTLTWNEGAVVQASFRGMSLSQAQALLAGLEWAAPDNHLAGFVPGAASPLKLLGQALASSPPVTVLEFGYADHLASQGTGQGLQLTVRTRTATGGLTADYLSVWFHGTKTSDGTVESFDSAFNTLSRAWPDGHSTWIDANATAFDEAQERRVADGLQMITTADLTERESQVAVVIGQDLPVIATVDLPAGTVQLHGDAALRALCFQPSGSTAATCSSLTTGDVPVVVGSALVNDHWFVTGAAEGPLAVQPPGIGTRPGSTSVPEPDMATQTATAVGWTLLVASPPVGLDSVIVSSGNQGSGATRPVA